MQPKISVVIPTYKRPGLLSACLEALTMQNVQPHQFEIIVVSDGADIDTKRAVNRFLINDFRIKYYELASKKGPAAARNLGWQKACSNLIAFTDDDCRPAKNWLYKILNAYNGELHIAFTGRVVVPVSGVPTDYEKNTTHLEKASFITANCCCTKQSLQLVGGFDERFSMAWREDSDLEFKLMLNNIPIVKLDDAVVVHPVRKAAWGVSVKEQKKGMFNALLYKKYPAIYRQRIQKVPAWDYYIMVLLFSALIIATISSSKYLATICLIGWLFLLIRFIGRRLMQTSHTAKHIAEMIATSLVIPFASVYWQLYGAVKYRVMFL